MIDSPVVQHRCGEQLHHKPCRQKRAHRVDNDSETKLLQLVGRQDRSDSAGQHISELLKRNIPHDACQFVDRLRSLDKAHVRSCIAVLVGTFDGCVEAFDGSRVGSGNDHKIGIAASVERHLQLIEHFFRWNHLLAAEMSTPFGSDLIFQQHPRRTSPFEVTHGPSDVMQISVPGIAVSDQRNCQTIGHPSDSLGHFGERSQANVRDSQHAGRNSKAPQEKQFDASLFQNPSRKHIVRGERPNDLLSSQHVAQPTIF